MYRFRRRQWRDIFRSLLNWTQSLVRSVSNTVPKIVTEKKGILENVYACYEHDCGKAVLQELQRIAKSFYVEK